MNNIDNMCYSRFYQANDEFTEYKIVKTIRASGGDYSLLSSCEAAIPADLVAVDKRWIAKAANNE